MLFNIIICEDIEHFSNEYKKVIREVKKYLNIEINIHSFKEYNNDFLKIINSDLENKIYILDLLMKVLKGNEIARIIRESDLVSFIIFITSHYDEYQKEIIDGEYSYLKFINKAGNYKQILFDTLVQNIEKKYRLGDIAISTEEQVFHIVPHSITQIYTKDRKFALESTVSQEPIIIPMSLKEIKEKLPTYFEYSKNCCLVNTMRISEIDKKKKIITFDNKTTTNLVSRAYLKQLLNIVEKNKKESSRS